MAKNENIANNGNMTYEQRIEMMKKQLGLKFVEEGKKTIKNAKVIKGEMAEKNFNTQLNQLTFEIEELYPLSYKEFKEEFPRTIELVKTIGGATVNNDVKKGLVIQAWYVDSNVEEIINNIKKNIEGKEEQERLISLRRDVQSEIRRMKEKFDIDWTPDLFYKCWHIKEGQARWKYLVSYKGEKLAKKEIDTIRKIGGLDFIEALQNEIYGDN